jgi:ankyrin repeat domain-containing protein 50
VWFTGHSLFRNWQDNAASLLWVSADPGCGKSVLARYLVDEALPTTKTRTTCYFFFKDDFDDQRSSTIALCSILRQIFIQRPVAFSTPILRKFAEDGEHLLKSFRDLWDLLVSVATSNKGGEIVCVLDVLDECEESERKQLITAISEFYSGRTMHPPALKFLVTSRPYLDIRRGFHRLECELPTIHLRGENEDEVAKISYEIDLVIRSRVADTSSNLGLSPEEQKVLEEELTRVPNRTYLWVHLIFNVINDSILNTAGSIRSRVRSIPRTVDEAYDRILSKSRDVNLTRKLLHIVVAANRPLTLREMSVALAIGPHHRSFDDLELVPEIRFRDDVRDLCGLFVVVVDSKIYLLHQTAREFLVPLPSPAISTSPGSSNNALLWKSSLHSGESHRTLAEICLWRLSLRDFDVDSCKATARKETYFATRLLLDYSATHWPDHFREGDWKDGGWATDMAADYCGLESLASAAWLRIYKLSRGGGELGGWTSLMVASYFGLSEVVPWLLKNQSTVVNERDALDGQSAIACACYNGHVAVVGQLLRAGADPNAKDDERITPLHIAATYGHKSIVQQLLGAGADPNTKDDARITPLHIAAKYGHKSIVQQLLRAGADNTAINKYGKMPLSYAIQQDHKDIMKMLFDNGATPTEKHEQDMMAASLGAEWSGVRRGPAGKKRKRDDLGFKDSESSQS